MLSFLKSKPSATISMFWYSAWMEMIGKGKEKKSAETKNNTNLLCKINALSLQKNTTDSKDKTGKLKESHLFPYRFSAILYAK